MARISVRDLRRRVPTRKPRLRILIVSEGAKTEGMYLSLFVRDLRAANVRVDILGKECGSDPQTVIEFAKKKFTADRGYDVCYCVIDRDNHSEARFNAALDISREVSRANKSRSFSVVVSDPCIEFWFLLHFVFWRAPFVSQGKKSRADCAVDELRKHMPGYGKANQGEMEVLLTRTDVARRHAERAMQDAEQTGESNPSTMMHALVDKLVAECRA